MIASGGSERGLSDVTITQSASRAAISPISGRFNAANALVALACGHVLGLELDAMAAALATVRPVPGRVQAVEGARAGDVVVIAGKGHEQGQEFEDGRKIPFDDREVAREELRKLAAGAPR